MRMPFLSQMSFSPVKAAWLASEKEAEILGELQTLARLFNEPVGGP
jgi:hypothetical protein